MAHVFDSYDFEKQYGLSRSAAKVYVYLKRVIYQSRLNGFIDRYGVYACVGRATLAKEIDRSEITAARAMAELKRAGLIHVRRTKSYAHIYLIQQQTTNDTCRRIGNDTSYIRNTRVNNTSDNSIYPQKEEPNAPAARMDGHERNFEPSVRLQETPTAPISTPASKGKPTPKRPRNDRAERRRAARARYAEALRKRLFYGVSGQTLAMLDDDGTRSAAAEAAITMLSDAVAAGRNFKIAGAYLTPGQYWNIVQWLDLDALEAVMERVNRAENVRNLTSYIYASLYNECAYRRLNAQVV